MEEIEIYLGELEEFLTHKNHAVLQKFQSPLSIAEIDNIFQKVGLDDRDLKHLYLWRNGINYNSGDWTVGEFDFFRFGLMISLKDSLEHYDWLTSEEIFLDNYFPLFTQGDGDFILFDFSGKVTDKMLWL